MTRERRAGVLRWTGGVVGCLLLSLALLLWTPPGHRTIGWAIAKITDGQVIVQGIDGALPGNISAQSVELRDAGGTWLRVSGVQLDWSILPALRGHYVLHRVSAAKVELLRWPLPTASSGGATPRIDLENLLLPHIDIAPSFIGYPAMLAARGTLHFVSRHQMSADLAITRPGGADHYLIKGGIIDDVVNGTAAIQESPDGLLGKIAGLPGLGAVALSAQAAGDRTANTVALVLTAGALKASGKGTISLTSSRADIDFSAEAPAMQLRNDIGWTSLTADGHVHGLFTAPQVLAAFRIAKFRAAGFAIDVLSADATGQSGGVDLSAIAEGLRLPGTYANLFAAAPVRAKLHADLADATRPVTFALVHPLMALDGSARTAGSPSTAFAVTVPSLAPFAALVGTDLRGSARLQVMAAQTAKEITLNMEGGLNAQGASMVARMLGADAALSFHAVVSGADVTASRVRLRGAGFDTSVTGGLRSGRMDYRVTASLLDLSRLTPALTGTARLSGAVTGLPAKALVDLTGDADMASHGFPRQRIAFRARATGLPNPATARVTADGKLDGANLVLAGDWKAAGAGHDAKLSLDWKSLAARAAVRLPLKGALTGHATLDAKNLGDVAPFVGMTVGGNLHVASDLRPRSGKQFAQLHVNAGSLLIQNVGLQSLQGDVNVADAFGAPQLDAKLGVKGLAASGVTGAATATLNGPLDKLATSIVADLKDPTAQPAHLTADAVLNVPETQMRLNQFSADWRDQTMTLSAPATFDLTGGVAVDRLALKAASGSIIISGRVSPKLALAASAENIQASAFKTFAPQLGAEGVLSGDANLTGTIAVPFGTVVLRGRGLRVSGYSSRLAPAALDARAQLQGGSALIDVKLAAGDSGTLSLHGGVPLSPDRALDLEATGAADLSMLNPLLAANGRQAKGRLSLDVHVAGLIAAPRLSGTAALRDAELQDYTQGLRLHDLNADFKADGNVIQIVRFQGQAGPGTIGGSGTVDMFAPGWPVALQISARNARPIVSEQLTASLSGDLKLAGKLRGAMTLSGKLDVPRAELNLPDSFPPQVRTLNIRRRGEKPPPLPATVTALGLDLTVATTGPITVRGHGIDADLGGNLKLSGSSGAPLVGGGFDMQRGTLTVAGQILDFTTGKVTFDGTGVRNRLDPTLDFIAQTTSGGVTATLTVTGYASAPKIALSSSPQLPQDEVLAHLLFQQSAKQLSPLQLAQIAQALASLGGIGNGFDPVASLRGGLGLDRLAVGGGNGVTSGATVEAGKYVARNIYVGAKQGLSGGTQAQVQIDITHNLKAQATVSTGANATATQGTTAEDTGSNIGLSYQFEY